MSLLPRRTLLAAPFTLLCSRSYCQEQTSEEKAQIDQWMSSWMNISKKPNGPLHISRFADPMYFLLRKIEWIPDTKQTNELPSVEVPPGFVTDFASVPRIFWSALRPDGLYTYPAIIHDWLYWEQTCPKSVADKILDIGMDEFGVDSITRLAISSAVSSFGGSAWEGNRRAKRAGERRILTRMPDDPTVTWAQWRNDPNNFL